MERLIYPKNICEVSIKLENDENIIQYKNTPEIEIKRKLEKDKGSKYYINGKEVRAKDVQILFADLSTGPHSPSMVSQGRVGALITAKPTDRRAIWRKQRVSLDFMQEGTKQSLD